MLESKDCKHKKESTVHELLLEKKKKKNPRKKKIARQNLDLA